MSNFEALMSKRKSKKKQPPGHSSRTSKGRLRQILIAVAAISAVVVAARLLYVKKEVAQDEKKERLTPVESAEVEEANGSLQALIGRWLRQDGGYIIEIRSISANGKLDAGYFNPRPINVSRAEASHRGDEVRVFVELQDVGYPGSTYTLIYDPEPEVLRGVYFHAGLSQTFDVVFVRTQ
jgi:hypothetical protein